MKIKSLVALVAGLNCIFAALLQAQAPQMFRYQGRLLDNDALVSGNLNFSFKLYSAPTGGAALYEDAATVTVVDGLYSTMIGDDTTSGGDLSAALKNSAVYLEITVDGETLAPRERIVSVPYAMNDNGLPSGTVVLSASNPNLALEAEDYSLVYSDVTSPEDWAVALQDELAIPFTNTDLMFYRQGLVTFGDYGGFAGEGDADNVKPFFYSRDGVAWIESMPPFTFVADGMATNNSVEMAGRLYAFKVDQSNFRVAVTANGANWEELTVSVPVVLESMGLKVEAFANQLWLFGSVNTGQGSEIVVLKSSDGAAWTTVDAPAWSNELVIVSTPDRLLVAAPQSGGTPSERYVWSTTVEASWSQSTAVLPLPIAASPYGDSGDALAFANGALWVIGTPEGETDIALYQSTDWGDSWEPVSTNLQLPNNSDYFNLMNLGTAPGLLLSNDNSTGGGYLYITENGSEWSKVSSEGYEVVISDSGQIWLFDDYVDAGSSALYSIGGPLRNGRFFYYQKD